MSLQTFLSDYANSETVRFHMPGHKGNFPPLHSLGDLSRYDITEIKGADVLYQSNGILSRLEKEIATFYGASGSAISTCGSTLCIQTMLAVAFQKGDRILAVRNAHTAFINACGLLDLQPIWILPQEPDPDAVGGVVTSAQVAAALDQNPEVKGVYLTSPDYHGAICDIAAIASICQARGRLLLVDNAHGAALKLSTPDLHPITLGADLCCDSAHKTLPVLTGGAFLHYTDRFTAAEIKKKMALFGTTSPSYLTLLSIAVCFDYLKTQGEADYQKTAEMIAQMKSLCDTCGVSYQRSSLCDPYRLTLLTAKLGLTDQATGELLRQSGIEPEYVGGGHAVLLATPCNRESDWDNLRGLIRTLGNKTSVPLPSPAPLPPPEIVLTPAKALFAESELLPTKNAVGRIAATTVIACPPGIPLLLPGERITPQIVAHLKENNTDEISVVIKTDNESRNICYGPKKL